MYFSIIALKVNISGEGATETELMTCALRSSFGLFLIQSTSACYILLESEVILHLMMQWQKEDAKFTHLILVSKCLKSFGALKNSKKSIREVSKTVAYAGFFIRRVSVTSHRDNVKFYVITM